MAGVGAAVCQGMGCDADHDRARTSRPPTGNAPRCCSRGVWLGRSRAAWCGRGRARRADRDGDPGASRSLGRGMPSVRAAHRRPHCRWALPTLRVMSPDGTSGGSVEAHNGGIPSGPYEVAPHESPSALGIGRLRRRAPGDCGSRFRPGVRWGPPLGGRRLGRPVCAARSERAGR